VPSILLLRVSSGENSARALDREADLMKELPDVASVIGDAKLLPDDAADHRRGPDPAIKSIRYRPAFDDVSQLNQLPGSQMRRPP
jgi:hypothetical protein